MLTRRRLEPRRAQDARRGHPPAPAARARRQQGRPHRRAAEKIFIEFSHAKLATLGITPQQIFDSVARQNAVVAGGSVETSADRINLRVTGAFSGAEAIAAVPVQADGRVFRLGDIATVKRGYEDPPTFLVREGGKPALGLGVSMQDGANIITLGENLKQRDGVRSRPSCRSASRSRRSPTSRRSSSESVSEFVESLRRGARHRAGGELPVARLAHRHRGRAVGAAGAGDRVRRHVRAPASTCTASRSAR